MKTLLISGITGFVGSNLTAYLKNGYEIIGISRKSNNTILSYNELNSSVLNNTNAFIHLAGKAHDLKKTADDSAYFTVNTALTKQLFDQFLKSDCEVFIYLSSVKAAADVVEGVLTETVIPNPITAYGKSKLAAEEYLLSKEIPTTKRVYILRPCMIHGPNNKGNLNLLLSFVAKGIPYPFGSYNNKRSFVSVDNLCFIINELLDNPAIPSGIYNVADDDALSTNELIELIAAATNKKARIVAVSKKIVTAIARLGDVIHLPLNSERLDKLTENFVVDNTKIKDALQIDKMPITTKEGLTKTILSFNH